MWLGHLPVAVLAAFAAGLLPVGSSRSVTGTLLAEKVRQDLSHSWLVAEDSGIFQFAPGGTAVATCDQNDCGSAFLFLCEFTPDVAHNRSLSLVRRSSTYRLEGGIWVPVRLPENDEDNNKGCTTLPFNDTRKAEFRAPNGGYYGYGIGFPGNLDDVDRGLYRVTLLNPSLGTFEHLSVEERAWPFILVSTLSLWIAAFIVFHVLIRRLRLAERRNQLATTRVRIIGGIYDVGARVIAWGMIIAHLLFAVSWWLAVTGSIISQKILLLVGLMSFSTADAALLSLVVIATRGRLVVPHYDLDDQRKQAAITTFFYITTSYVARFFNFNPIVVIWGSSVIAMALIGVIFSVRLIVLLGAHSALLPPTSRAGEIAKRKRMHFVALATLVATYGTMRAIALFIAGYGFRVTPVVLFSSSSLLLIAGYFGFLWVCFPVAHAQIMVAPYFRRERLDPSSNFFVDLDNYFFYRAGGSWVRQARPDDLEAELALLSHEAGSGPLIAVLGPTRSSVWVGCPVDQHERLTQRAELVSDAKEGP